MRRLAALGTAVAALAAIFATVVQPWYARWGATDVEAVAPLPGDGIVTGAVKQETHAITIDAPVERVWPWLAQIGQDRGGFYSYDVLENLVGCRMPTDDRLRPDRQDWKIADRLWMYPPEAAGGIGYAVLREYEPGRALAFGTHVPSSTAAADQGSWAFILEPVGSDRTRLVVRGRAQALDAWTFAGMFDQWIFSPVHFAMERRMMIGLKEVAEHGTRSRGANLAQVGLWTVTFLAVVVLAGLAVGRRRWMLPIVGLTAIAALFMFLTLRQPPVIVGAGLLVVGLALLRRGLSRTARNNQHQPGSLSDLSAAASR